jgi:hypothetical protein
MRQYGRHLSALPECIGWVDFGYNCWPGWESFDLTRDPWMHERVLVTQVTLPGAMAPQPPPPPNGGGSMNQQTAAAIRAAADAAQVLRLNRGAAIQKRATADGYLIVGNETTTDGADGQVYVTQKAEHPTTGVARYYYGVKPDWGRVYYLGGA